MNQRAAALCLLLTVGACGPEELSAEYPVCTGYAAPSFLGLIDSDNLMEVSGLGVSEQNPGLIWLHNDSGHAAVLYGIDAQRNVLRELVFEGLAQTDWEDIALGPCGTTECIFIGDIGDNDNTRETVSLIVLEEPAVDMGGDYRKELVQDYATYRFEYPDGPHDAEALAVTADGQIYLFTKEQPDSRVFRVPGLERATIQELEPVAELDLEEKITAADFHRSGRKLLLRTRASIFELDLDPGALFDGALTTTRVVSDGDSDRQSEAVGYDPHTGSILHAAETAEDAPRLYELRCGDSG